MKRATHTPQFGFSLIELMVTLTVATILLSTAVPGFRQLIQNNKVATDVNEFVAALHLARSEAIKRGVRVSVCRSTTQTSCATTGGWEQGWIVFVDDKATAGTVETGEEILRVHGALTSGTTLRGNNNVQARVSFLASGFSGGTNGSIILCDGRVANFSTDKKFARVGIISTLGRVRVVPGDHADVPVSLTSCTP